MCCVDYADEDGTWLGEVSPRAAKEHRCGNCRRTIGKGETYHKGTWTSSGELYSFKMCSHCHTAAEGWLRRVCHGYLWGEGECGGLVYDDLREHWDEHGWPVKTVALGRLVVGMQRQWKRRDGKLWLVDVVQEWARVGAQSAMAVPA